MVTVDEGEFWAEIDPARKQRKKVKRTAFSTCVDTSVKDVLRMLRRRDDYDPYFLTDDNMGINRFADACQQPFINSQARAQYRAKFRKELEKGAEGICVQVFGKQREGALPDCIFVWKVPAVHGALHVGKSHQAIAKARLLVPKFVGREAVAHFNRILN